MYCKVCGNLLEESDLICKVCGADIKEQRRRAINDAVLAGVLPIERLETYHAVFTNDADCGDNSPNIDPAFGAIPKAFVPKASEKAEVRMPEASGDARIPLLGAAEENAAFALKATWHPKLRSGEFHWNVHEFPSAGTRKTEEIDFDWNMALSALDAQTYSDNENSSGSEENCEEAVFDAGDFAAQAEHAASELVDMDEPPASRAEEESDDGIPAWLRADSAPSALSHSPDASDGRPQRERFFTFDTKNEEFQRLLDREYERLQSYDSPIVNEARDMLASWDLSASFAGKRTSPATAIWIPSSFIDEANLRAKREEDRGESENFPIKVKKEPVPEVREEPSPEIKEEPVPEVKEEPSPNIKAGAEPEAKAETEPGLKFKTEPEPEIEASHESSPTEETEETAPIDRVPESNITETEFSINRTLDSIEKEIEDWEGREKISTASKVAVIVSIIFLMFTGGSAAVKYFAPHSPVDVWFDSVQLQASSTVKHGVDMIRDFFNDSEEETQESEEG